MHRKVIVARPARLAPLLLLCRLALYPLISSMCLQDLLVHWTVRVCSHRVLFAWIEHGFGVETASNSAHIPPPFNTVEIPPVSLDGTEFFHVTLETVSKMTMAAMTRKTMQYTFSDQMARSCVHTLRGTLKS